MRCGLQEIEKDYILKKTLKTSGVFYEIIERDRALL